jgi:hypothetical protein
MAATNTLFQWTLQMDDVMARARHNPIPTFEAWPLLEVRRKCLEHISFIDEDRAQWIEGFLLEAEGHNSGNRDPLGAEVLACYVKHAKEKLGARAIGFAIERRGAWTNSFVSKIVNGRLKQDPWLWHGIPNLIEFLEECLRSLLGAERFGRTYTEETWNTAERAIQMIARAEEVRLRTLILKIERSMKDRKIIPWGNLGSSEQLLRFAQHKAFLLQTLAMLRAA